MECYDEEFFSIMAEGSQPSAEIMTPYLMELLDIDSVVDLGCGTGEWLNYFKKGGASRVLGVEGPWLDMKQIQVDVSEILIHDLNNELKLDEQFDVATSFEVVVHLPEAKSQGFVDTMTRLAPVVFFSAPIPHQRSVGPGPHNNKWQIEWAKMFEKNGYVAIDCIRPEFWYDDRIEWWYLQNMLVFVKKDRLDDYPRLKAEYEKNPNPVMSCVHPRYFLSVMERYDLVERIGRPINKALTSLGIKK
ncbi:class I SAM-dependent methyltransferase [Flavobacteriaceae bacterium]|jgi:SAM-dependent methyltransferase|nr:class I SAM-dependent methyltransferase [Puniceicoccaceae bacterium]MDB4028456.1 class I SAM-dependent methyltransferase [Flavobacteriaceae bacterium]